MLRVTWGDMSEENFICSFLVSDDGQCNRWGGRNQVFFIKEKNWKAICLKKLDVSHRKVQNLLRSPAAKRIRIISPIKSPIEFRKYLAISELSIFSPVSYKRQRTALTPKAGPVHGEPNKNDNYNMKMEKVHAHLQSLKQLRIHSLRNFHVSTILIRKQMTGS